jgi:hypothetical protein
MSPNYIGAAGYLGAHLGQLHVGRIEPVGGTER